MPLFNTNKVRVTRSPGGNGFVGMMDPKVGMNTNQGKILALRTQNNQIVVGAGSGSVQRLIYPHQCYVTVATATGTYSYPSGDGSVVFGHKSIFPNGITVVAGTGVSYKGGDGKTKSIIAPRP
jgi:hypothetical protein